MPNVVVHHATRRSLPDEGLLSLNIVAKEIVGIHRATLYRWIDEGRFPAPNRIGGRCFYRVSTVRNWLDEYAPETHFERRIVKQL